MQVDLEALAAPGEKVGGEIHRRQQHEYDQHELDGGRIEIPDAGIMRGKTAQPHRGKGVADRIQPIHSRQLQRHDTCQRDTCINQPKVARRLGDARRERGILHRPRRLSLEQLASADAEQRQYGHRQHDDAHAAQPIQFVPPQIDRRWQIIQPGKYRRTRGGDTGHGLEIRVGE